MQCFKIAKSITEGIERMCRSFFWGQRAEERKTAWVAWEKLFLPKKEGGLGIRNFEIFNQALLAKQAWRILTQPDSLMTRVLKNKYFPNSTFLKAKVSPNMSFTCRSILEARDVIAKGMCRVIGDGKDTKIWHDPWVPKFGHCRVERQEDDGESGRPQMVSELLVDDGWNVTMLNNLFSPWESRAIQSIPIQMFRMKDEWMWVHSKSGQFTVRSAYFHELFSARRTEPSTSHSSNRRMWQQLWSLKIPPKAKLFGWKVLKDGIPTKHKLQTRGMCSSSVCPRCGEEDENIEHMLLRCRESVRIWYGSPLRIESDKVGDMSIKEWVDNLMAHKKEPEWWALFWMLIWNIWLGRNMWVFERKRLDFMSVLDRAVRGTNEFIKDRDDRVARGNLEGEEVDVRWKAPGEGVLKLNSDAALIKGVDIGMGSVVRDSLGEVLMATCCGLMAVDSPDLAEALSMRHGLKVAVEAGLRALMVETDCKKLVTHLQSRRREDTAFGSIVHDILALASHCNQVCFVYVRRQGNRVAHLLAQLCKSNMDLQVWLEECPIEVWSAVMVDKSLT